jgi:hypothetical protein
MPSWNDQIIDERGIPVIVLSLCGRRTDVQ